MSHCSEAESGELTHTSKEPQITRCCLQLSWAVSGLCHPLVDLVCLPVYRMLLVLEWGLLEDVVAGFKTCVLKPFSQKNAIHSNQGFFAFIYSQCFFFNGAHKRAT